jgi:hypothetical protein
MSTLPPATPPVKIQEYIFMWSYVISFVGAVFFSLSSLINIEPASLIVNKNILVVVNITIGISGIVSLFVFFNQDVPSLDKALLDQHVVKANVNN